MIEIESRLRRRLRCRFNAANRHACEINLPIASPPMKFVRPPD
ncbi:Uncharacterised protein [Vibrio cholerae]|nr:Uncharacterised protein [Vibrio cholerae]